MAQTQTLNYASNIQTAEQKFAQKVDSLNLKISKAISVFKEKVSKWTSSPSSRSPYTVSIQEAKELNRVRYVSLAEKRRQFPLM